MKIRYETSDFLTASVLLLRKHHLISTDATDPRRVVFIFENSDRLQHDLELLKRDELLVNPSDFWTAERRAKQIIYAESRHL